MIEASIIVPVYNAGRTLAIVLDSVLNQTLDKNKYEVILVNDGSTDNSEEIIKEFIRRNRKKIKIKYKKQENKGCPSSRNVGLGMAEGRFILSLDSDQEVSSGLLEECLKYSKKGRLIISIPEIGTGKNIISKFAEYERRINFYKTNRDIPRFYPRKILEEIGGWNPELWLGEDFDVYQRVLSRGWKMVIIEKNLIKHHETNSLKSLIRKYFIYGKSAPKILKLHRKESYRMYSGMNKQLWYNIIAFFFKNPFLWIGAMFIKFVRYSSTLLGMLYVKFKNENH